jgi:hypothetical protein
VGGQAGEEHGRLRDCRPSSAAVHDHHHHLCDWFGSEIVLGVPAKFIEGGLHAVVEDPFGAGMCLILVGLFFAASSTA